jgi:hypothetical protein
MTTIGRRLRGRTIEMKRAPQVVMLADYLSPEDDLFVNPLESWVELTREMLGF